MDKDRHRNQEVMQIQIDASASFIEKAVYNKSTKQYMLFNKICSLVLTEKPLPEEVSRILWIGGEKTYIEVLDMNSPLKLMIYPGTEMTYLRTIMENLGDLRGMYQLGLKVYNKAIIKFIKTFGINSNKRSKITQYSNYSFREMPLVVTDRSIFFRRAYEISKNRAIEFSLEYNLEKDTTEMGSEMIAYIETLKYDAEDNMMWPEGNRKKVKPEEVVGIIIGELKKKGN